MKGSQKFYTFNNIGTSNFEELVTSTDLFVDKTLFIESILKKGTKVNLITRPRRWGKTLNMTMVQYFFSVPLKDDGSVDEEERQKRHTLFSQMKIGQVPDVLQNYTNSA